MTPILHASACPQCGSSSGGCTVGETCLPDDYIDPADCPPGACPDGEECLPSDFIDPADCPACVDCADSEALVIAHRTGTGASNDVTVALDGLSHHLETTPGSTIFVVVHTFDNGAYADGDVLDNKGNPFTLLKAQNTGSGPGVGVWVQPRDGVRGLWHSFTFTGDNIAPTIEVLESTGLDLAAFDTTTDATSTDAASPFDVTAAAAIVGRQWSLYASTLDAGTSHAWGMPAGYTEIGQEGDGTSALVGMSAYKIEETGTPTVGATWAGTAAAAANVLVTVKIADCPACGACGDCVPGSYVPYCVAPNDQDWRATVTNTSPFGLYIFTTGNGGADQSGNGHDALSAIGTLTLNQPDLSAKVSDHAALSLTNGGSIRFPPPVANLTSAALPWACAMLLRFDAYDSGVGGSAPFSFISWSGSSPPKMGHFVEADGHLVLWTDSTFGDLGTMPRSRQPLSAIGEPHVLILNTLAGAGTVPVGSATIEAWIDGVLVLTSTTDNSGVDGSVFSVGRLPGGGPFFGAVDLTFGPFATWDRALTYAEIQAISEALLDDAILATSWVPA